MVYMMVLIVQAFVGNCVFLISELFVISNSYCVVLIHYLYPFDNELQCIKQSKLHIEFSFNYWILPEDFKQMVQQNYWTSHRDFHDIKNISIENVIWVGQNKTAE